MIQKNIRNCENEIQADEQAKVKCYFFHRIKRREFALPPSLKLFGNCSSSWCVNAESKGSN